MAPPPRSRDPMPRSQARPILPPSIDARTHMEVAEAYLEMGLPDEALFELTLVGDDPSAKREADRLAARIKAQQAQRSRQTASVAQAPCAGVSTRVEGLRQRGSVIQTLPAQNVDDAIDSAFAECFVDEAPTERDQRKARAS